MERQDQAHDLSARDLGTMLGRLFFDIQDAAVFIGVSGGVLIDAMSRRHIAYVRYRSHRYLARRDLVAYRAARASGQLLPIGREPAFEVVGRGVERWAWRVRVVQWNCGAASQGNAVGRKLLDPHREGC